MTEESEGHLPDVVAYASGGLWYTDNNGTSFTPVMDNSSTQNIGDIAVHWPTHTLYVGTGENNASRSSYAGTGILKSTDKGTSWIHIGLEAAHHIGKIEINPSNPDEVVVGVTGPLYSNSNERGIYKTTNGGQTWEQKLNLPDPTGIIELSVVPENYKIQYIILHPLLNTFLHIHPHITRITRNKSWTNSWTKCRFKSWTKCR